MAAATELEALCMLAVPLLDGAAHELAAKRRAALQVIFSGSGARLDIVNRVDAHDVVARVSKRIYRLPAYAAATQALRATREASPEALSNFLLALLRELLWQRGPSDLATASRELATAANKAWTSDTVDATRSSLVVGIHPDSVLPSFASDIELIPASDDLRNEFWNDPRLLSFVPGPNAINALSVSHVLRIRRPIPASDVLGYLGTFGRRTERNVISSLRMCLGVPLGLVATKVSFLPLPMNCTGVSLEVPRPETFVRGASQDAKMSANHAEEAQRVFGMLQSNIPMGYDLALRRFNFSFERQEPDDALLDLAIALEATVLHGIDSELSFRLRLLGAALLPQDSQVAEQLTQFYKLRSKVAHGSTSLSTELKKPRQADDYIVATRLLVSRLLLAYLTLLQDRRSMTEIKAHLETRLLDGLHHLTRP